jgi:hypothetical protein
MKYGKLDSGKVVYAPYPLIIDDKNVFTTDANVYMAAGYKRIVSTTAPQQNGYVAHCTWVETDAEIVQTWELSPSDSSEDDFETLKSQLNQIMEVYSE